MSAQINIMIDLETMGTGPDAAIVSLGAVSFSKNILESRFYEVIDLESSVGSGGILEPATVLWWLTQNEAARKAITLPGISVINLIHKFNEWCASLGEKKDLLLWGNGSDFDNVILASTYRRMGMTLPWYYTHNRCYRTVKSLYPELKIRKNGTPHNALHDAENQANHLIDIFNYAKKSDR